MSTRSFSYSSSSVVFVHSVSRSFVFAGKRSVDRLIVNSAFSYPFARPGVRSLRLPFVRSFAFSVCSIVPPFAQFFFLFMGINML